MCGTAHFFAGTKEIAQRFLDIGFYISFSGVITFVPEYEEVVKFVPLDRILPETDAPFATPTPHRGKRNQPEYVLEVVKKNCGNKRPIYRRNRDSASEKHKNSFRY